MPVLEKLQPQFVESIYAEPAYAQAEQAPPLPLPVAEQQFRIKKNLPPFDEIRLAREKLKDTPLIPVAIIGAGKAGIEAARILADTGKYLVWMMEKESTHGGLGALRGGISSIDHRKKKQEVAEDGLVVASHPNVIFTPHFEVNKETIRQVIVPLGFKKLLYAHGSQENQLENVDYEGLQGRGVWKASEFIQTLNNQIDADEPLTDIDLGYRRDEHGVPRKIVLVGGGKVSGFDLVLGNALMLVLDAAKRKGIDASALLKEPSMLGGAGSTAAIREDLGISPEEVGTIVHLYRGKRDMMRLDDPTIDEEEMLKTAPDAVWNKTTGYLREYAEQKPAFQETLATMELDHPDFDRASILPHLPFEIKDKIRSDLQDLARLEPKFRAKIERLAGIWERKHPVTYAEKRVIMEVTDTNGHLYVKVGEPIEKEEDGKKRTVFEERETIDAGLLVTAVGFTKDITRLDIEGTQEISLGMALNKRGNLLDTKNTTTDILAEKVLSTMQEDFAAAQADRVGHAVRMDFLDHILSETVHSNGQVDEVFTVGNVVAYSMTEQGFPKRLREEWWRKPKQEQKRKMQTAA